MPIPQRMTTVTLALYPIALLAAEAAPGEAVVEQGSWNGVTLDFDVADRARRAV